MLGSDLAEGFGTARRRGASGPSGADGDRAATEPLGARPRRGHAENEHHEQKELARRRGLFGLVTLLIAFVHDFNLTVAATSTVPTLVT